MSALTVRDPDVLVVGAGPVGLLLACELARRGVAVRIIDKLPTPTSESRAIIVHARSLEMMERIGVAEEVISTGLTVKAAELHLDGTTAARMPLDTVDSPYPFSVTLPQTETEWILAERLRELGVEVERGTELVAFDQDDWVEASLRLAAGRQETAGCAFIVGADGSHSTVRSAAGTKALSWRARSSARSSCSPMWRPTTAWTAAPCTRSSRRTKAPSSCSPCGAIACA